jgi:DNA adenine methylase
MPFDVPHPIPYQGSKRRLAEAILSQFPDGRFERLIEPFAGSAALTLASAKRRRFGNYILGDALEPLAELWQGIIRDPEPIASEYESMWFRERAKPIDAYYEIRAEFNADRSPSKLLYLLARCVKNAVRFNPSGSFNQSPDKRRKGTHPATMRSELYGAHALLHGRSESRCADFAALLAEARETDLIYMDPPYQGTSDGRDQRYIRGLGRDRVIAALEDLNSRGIQFILSYDGSLGEKSYGSSLPESLARQLLLDVGRSSQATLNGGSDVTVESL